MHRDSGIAIFYLIIGVKHIINERISSTYLLKGDAMGRFFASKKGILAVGLFIGAAASLLQKLGNPGNMGICVACFERDIAGAIGFHTAAVVQYIRPEIIGFVVGAFIISFLTGEFRARAGSAPIVRFMLGFFAMAGALVFLGCPWRALLRLAGGDGNAILGIAGLIAGIWVGIQFIKNGYNLGRSYKTYTAAGFVMPLIMIGLLLLLVIRPELSTGAPYFSQTGPGSMHAAVWISLVFGLVIGVVAQQSRFCTMGALRDVILIKEFHLMIGVVGFLIGTFVCNIIFGQFHPGFAGQPVAHTSHLWNFLGMALAGIAFVLAGGCPGRQLFLSGEGDGDAAVFVLGMITGAGFAHNFTVASSPAGPGHLGPLFVGLGLVVCIVIGLTMRKKM